MPHYKDGTEAKIGDRVRGTGYNAKTCGYDPTKGIEGVVTEVRPGEDKAGGCTLTVAYLQYDTGTPDAYREGITRFRASKAVADGIPLAVNLEYGDTVGFEKVG